MTRQVINQNLPIMEGAWDKTNRLAFDAALDRADSNFSETYTTTAANSAAVTDLYARPLGAMAPTVAWLGDSIIGLAGFPIGPGSSSIVGDGTTTTVTFNGSLVLDGSVLNVTCTGAPFDQQQVVATQNAGASGNTFTFPSTLNGQAPTSGLFYINTQPCERGFVNWAMRLSGHRIRTVNNSGFAGSTATQALSRIATQIAPYRPRYCVVMVGINDAAAGTAAATIMATLTQIYTTLITAGVIPIACTILPLHSSQAQFATATPIVLATNHLIRNYCSANGIACADTFLAMVDTSQSDGRGISTLYPGAGANDYTHPNVQGARLVGQVVANLFSSLPQPQLLTVNAADNSTTNANNYNITEKGPWDSSGGSVTGTGASGTAPSGFTVTNSGSNMTTVVSVPARTVNNDGDTVGNNIQAVMTAAGSGTVLLYCNADITSRLVAGATYEWRCTLRLSGVSGSKLYKIDSLWNLYNLGATIQTQMGAMLTDVVTQTDIQYADGTYIIRSPPIPVPSWKNSNWRPSFFFYFSAAGTALTVNIGRCTMMRVS